MTTTQETKILYDSDSAASYKTNIRGWMDRRGIYYGDDPNSEHTARYSGCTHIKCAGCETILRRGDLRCHACIKKENRIKHERRDAICWNKKVPLYSETEQKYFFTTNDLKCFLKENNCTAASLCLVVCDPCHLDTVDQDYFEDQLCEDDDLPQDVIEAMETFNKVIKAQAPVSWWPGKYAAIIDDQAISNEQNSI